MNDLLFVNGKFYTQNPAYLTVSAVAIRNGRFVAVGSDDEIRALAGPGIRMIDLEGRRVLPGLADSHVHFYDWALGRKQLNLVGVTSLAHLKERLGQFDLAKTQRDWIVGQGWIESTWPEHRLPDRADLDQVVPNNPTILWRTDLHLAVVNSLALQIAGITADTIDPHQGIIDHDPSGNPTGILRDLAINLVSEIIPPPDDNQAVAAIKEGFTVFHNLGLTSVHDQRIMGAPEGALAFSAWQQLQAAGEIQLRVWMNLPGERLNEVIALGLRTGFGDDFLRVGHVKFFIDGAQGPRTAWMLEPYEGVTTSGLPITSIRDIKVAIQRADAAGLAVAIHAIGDRANRELINVLEDLLDHQATPIGVIPCAPHRIEHIQIIQPEDLSRLSRLPVMGSLQPLQITDDIPIMESTIGARSRFAYSFRSIWDTGIPITFNSDCPVCNPNPFWGIHAAVTRQRRDGTPPGGWHPEQCVTVKEAVWAYSMGAAKVSGRQADLGSISPGKLADMVVIDRDVFSIDPTELFEVKPVMTVFNGKIVFEA